MAADLWICVHRTARKMGKKRTKNWEDLGRRKEGSAASKRRADRNNGEGAKKKRRRLRKGLRTSGGARCAGRRSQALPLRSWGTCTMSDLRTRQRTDSQGDQELGDGCRPEGETEDRWLREGEAFCKAGNRTPNASGASSCRISSHHLLSSLMRQRTTGRLSAPTR